MGGVRLSYRKVKFLNILAVLGPDMLKSDGMRFKRVVKIWKVHRKWVQKK